jgi:hypothetical protein
MNKRGKSTETKLINHFSNNFKNQRGLSQKEIVKQKNRLKSKIFTRLKIKHNSRNNNYNSILIESLIFNKNTHYTANYKDGIILDFTDEYLKRYC